MHRRPSGGAGTHNLTLATKTHSSPGRTQTAHLDRLDVPDGEPDELRQVADGQIGHAGAQNWTHQSLVVQRCVL